MSDLSETFWVAFVASIIGFLCLSLKMCLKSKCDSIEICGLKIHRNIEAEIEEEKYDIEHHISDIKT